MVCFGTGILRLYVNPSILFDYYVLVNCTTVHSIYGTLFCFVLPPNVLRPRESLQSNPRGVKVSIRVRGCGGTYTRADMCTSVYTCVREVLRTSGRHKGFRTRDGREWPSRPTEHGESRTREGSGFGPDEGPQVPCRPRMIQTIVSRTRRGYAGC